MPCNCESDDSLGGHDGSGKPVSADAYRMLSDIGSAISDVIKQDYVSDQVRMFRLRQCQRCPHRVNNINGRDDMRVKDTDQCNICNCFIRLKSKLSNQNCDVGKWVMPVNNNNVSGGETQENVS